MLHYKKELTCNYCKENFETTKILSSRAKLLRMDSDFCRHYENDNPMFYDVNVCPNCGYAFTAAFRKINQLTMEDLENNYIKKIKVNDYTGVRTIEKALNAFKLALLVAELTKERNVVIADICLKIAWIYRIKGDKEEELRFLKYSLSSFEQTMSQDDLVRQGIEEDKLIYLIAELNARLDNYTTARRWFSYLITDKSVSEKYKNYALNRWHEYKYEERNEPQD